MLSKNRRRFIIFLTLSAVFCSCKADFIIEGETYGDYPLRVFWSVNLSNSEYFQLAAQLLAEGEHCQIYVELGHSGISEAGAFDIARQYDEQIYPKITKAFGGIEDVDGNGKVILLSLDIKDGNSASSFVAGYFSSNDMLGDRKHSNEADMIYLDINQQKFGGQSYFATAAHELQHLINFSQTQAKGFPAYDTWINEGLSTAAEYLYNDGDPNGRIHLYNSDPFGTIVLGNNFLIWDGYWENADNSASFPAGVYYDPLANYATAYLFFQWLRIHAISAEDETGVLIYKAIIDSHKSGYEAVTSAAASYIDEEYADWDKLFQAWLIANALPYNENAEEGSFAYKYGYRKQLAGAINAPRFFKFDLSGGTSWNLYAGEAVYSQIGVSAFRPNSSDSGADINYFSFSKDKGITERKPYPANTVLVTRNENRNTGASAELGFLAPPESSSTSGAAFSMNLNAAAVPLNEGRSPPSAKYPIDFIVGEDF